MKNGEYEFATMLNEMENEVLALKTAHQRPLGALDFFKDSIQFTVNLNSQYGTYYREFEVVVKIAEPTAKPPILQPAIDTPAGFFVVWLDDVSASLNYDTWTYRMYLISPNTSSGVVKFGVLSSQPIESITWSYI